MPRKCCLALKDWVLLLVVLLRKVVVGYLLHRCIQYLCEIQACVLELCFDATSSVLCEWDYVCQRRKGGKLDAFKLLGMTLFDSV